MIDLEEIYNHHKSRFIEKYINYKLCQSHQIKLVNVHIAALQIDLKIQQIHEVELVHLNPCCIKVITTPH